MDNISKEQFLALAKEKRDTCITMYLPTHRAGFEVNERQDWLLYKNMLRDVERQLQALGKDKAVIGQLLRPAFDLLEDKKFWYALDQSLALFITEGSFQAVKLPIQTREETYINNTFYLTPIFSLLNEDQTFYVLALSKNAASFYAATAFSVKELSISGLPQGMDDVIHYEEKSGRRLFRAGSSPAAGVGNAHGHDAGLADEEEYLTVYLKEVDQTLWKEKLGNEKAPLLLAGVEYMVAKYKQVSRYGNIVAEHLAGNYERVDANAILEKAKSIMLPYLQKPAKDALTNYFNNLGGGTSCEDIAKIVMASHMGQVQDLFVKEHSHVWGKSDVARNQVTVHTEREQGDDCLINEAVSQTIRNRGNIYVLSEEEMPQGKAMVASFRY
ncbi:hypothetical protein [Olivibacter sp. XZL3]|uniref:baeRF7 domain-containing protein n=1 Tax=Olivibacter sp. XZL3 TaxID=1735116 RepID=UPI0010654F54|nr:hypothetical protein [Olivibacter sp. XZL3]